MLTSLSQPVIFAHRGASAHAPENTLAAFELALAQNADAIELDVKLSADGQVVVIHDATVDRTTDGRGSVAAMSAAEVGALDAGQGERVPPLDAVLDRYAATPLLIEVKEARAAGPALAAIQRRQAEPRVVVGSFVRRALVPFWRAGVASTPPRSGVALALLASRLGLGVPGPHRAFAVPEYHRGLRIVDRRFVRAARQSGRPVHVWTVNTLEQGRRLRAQGVCGIITDYPDYMRSI
jgi:glycerophosphoryl diester phosphodiesterase